MRLMLLLARVEDYRFWLCRKLLLLLFFGFRLWNEGLSFAPLTIHHKISSFAMDNSPSMALTILEESVEDAATLLIVFPSLPMPKSIFPKAIVRHFTIFVVLYTVTLSFSVDPLTFVSEHF